MPSEKPEKLRRNYKRLGLDALVCIGGNGTMKTAARLAEDGMNVIGVPKTIDNDVWGTDFSFGFHSAVTIATEAVDRLHTTANSHRRIMVLEVMGHHAGWIALFSGVAGGGDVILLPEIPYRKASVISCLKNRARRGKPYSIVVVAEGIEVPDRSRGLGAAGAYIARMIEKEAGLEARETILGYIQRGGTPTATDRSLATQLGAHAAELLVRRQFNRMVRLDGDRIGSISLQTAAGRIQRVPSNHTLLRQARRLGTCFGDKD
jgi:6-phosphofructokinase 1